MEKLSKVQGSFREIDYLCQQDNFINKLDARAKIFTTLLVLLGVVSVPRYEVAALLPFTIYPLFIVLFADIPIRFLTNKIIWLLPFALFLGILNPIFDQSSWVTPWGAAVSAGWLSLINIMLRFLLCISLTLLLFATTGIHRLVIGLQKLRLPNTLTTQIYLLYHYFYLAINELSMQIKAYHLRRLQQKRSIPLRFYKPLLITVFNKTLLRATASYHGMLARGFTGKLPMRAESRWSTAETCWVLAWGVFTLLCTQLPIMLFINHLVYKFIHF